MGHILLQQADDIEGLLAHFVDGSSLTGKFLPTEQAAAFKGMALEAKAVIDAELGRLNDFSMEISKALIRAEAGFIEGPSYADVQEIASVIRAAVRTIYRPKVGSGGLKNAIEQGRAPYVDPSRMIALEAADSRFDLSRLIQLCKELNSAWERDNWLSAAMLVRAITDHVPPILGQRNFSDVANHYRAEGSARSFKGNMKSLDTSLRHVADQQLHVQARAKDSLPTANQVNFSADLDVLLGEIVRVLN